MVLFVLVLVLRDPDAANPTAPTSPVLIAIAAPTCAALVARHRASRLVLALTTAGTALAMVAVDGRTAIVAAPLIALYTVAKVSDRRTTWIAWVATAASLTLVTLLSGPVSFWDNLLPYLPWTGVAAAVGDALRNRRAYVAAVEERAERAERTREEAARRRVAEERLRIARDLHDVVAHRIAVVNVQAGVASHLLSTRPEEAREALGHVREASGAILDELGDILNVLRQPGEPTEWTTPVPGLAQLEALVASFSTAGLVVDWSLTGKPRPLGPAVDLVAFRVLQEALTNAHRHGTGTAHLAVTYTPSALALHVSNPMNDNGSSTGRGPSYDVGHGLLGMRERAAAIGGVLQAAPTAARQFHVDVSLPIPVGDP